jgi:hypothetical protein
LAISADVADDRIELGQRDLQRMAPNEANSPLASIVLERGAGNGSTVSNDFAVQDFATAPESQSADCSRSGNRAAICGVLPFDNVPSAA